MKVKKYVGFWEFALEMYSIWGFIEPRVESKGLLKKFAYDILHKSMFTPLDHEVGPWKIPFSHGPIFFFQESMYKTFGTLLGVNRTLTKSNDGAPKNEHVGFL